MSAVPSRDVWCATFVGMVDVGFRLDEDEFDQASRIVGRLLEALRIPGRASVLALPAAVRFEQEAGLFSRAAAARRAAGAFDRRDPGELPADAPGPDAWVVAFLSMLTAAYPDLRGEELEVAASCFTDLLAALSAGGRVPVAFPEDVLRANRTL